MNDTYILQHTQLAHKRLALQHQLYKASSQQLLIDAGISPGQHVLEVGCGTGMMTPWLADEVGKQGYVLAIDNAPKCIEETRQQCRVFSQVDVLQHDVFSIDEINHQFDLIYVRMVLHHLHDPVLVLQKLIKQLKPNGTLVCEEPPAMEGTYVYPSHPYFNRFRSAVSQCFTQMQKVYDIAYTLKAVLEENDLTITYCGRNQPLCLEPNERLLHHQGFIEIFPALVKCGLFEENERENFSLTLKQLLLSAKKVALYQLHQIIAKLA